MGEANARKVQLGELLSESQIYRDYREAFQKATGLPLRLGAPGKLQCLGSEINQSPFCALMARTNKACAACYALQRDLERESRLAPRTLHCFAGLCETAVPVRVGENLLAFLATGHVFLHRPTKSQFNRVASYLLKWGSEVDLKSFEEAYLNTRVLEEDHYTACIRLLEIFAKHLGECANHLIQQHAQAEPLSVKKARTYIAEHADDDLSLARISKAVNVSANYFSTLFKQATGLNFADYVARVRIGKTKNLLLNPNLRISEIAFDVGFQSLSQFNRSFRRVVGVSPKEYRNSSALNSATRQI
jgi:AraC-like DNA-binding protein/ligand-binding sensor protein